jgi:hypothetical protein
MNISFLIVRKLEIAIYCCETYTKLFGSTPSAVGAPPRGEISTADRGGLPFELVSHQYPLLRDLLVKTLLIEIR